MKDFGHSTATVGNGVVSKNTCEVSSECPKTDACHVLAWKDSTVDGETTVNNFEHMIVVVSPSKGMENRVSHTVFELERLKAAELKTELKEEFATVETEEK